MNLIEKLLLILFMAIVGYLTMKYGFPLILDYIASLTY